MRTVGLLRSVGTAVLLLGMLLVGSQIAFAHACGVCDSCIDCKPCEELDCKATPSQEITRDGDVRLRVIGRGFAANAPIRVDCGATQGVLACFSTDTGEFEAEGGVNLELCVLGPIVAVCQCEACLSGDICASQQAEASSGTSQGYTVAYLETGPVPWSISLLGLVVTAALAGLIIWLIAR